MTTKHAHVDDTLGLRIVVFSTMFVNVQYEEGFQRNQLNNLAIYNFDFAGDSANSSR